jgi:iron complex outermembrane recepter protein
VSGQLFGGSASVIRRRSQSLAYLATRSRTLIAFVSFLLILVRPTGAQQKTVDLANQSLEDLMNIQVVSVSKTEQSISRTAAAIFVITQEDIRRSGATNIPDLLRMVPGMDVGQIDSNVWAISARGFNGRFANKLLVLLDGRSVYAPSFGGVFWDTLDLPLEDIERIEVIRGPGGSIWGTNAVNGVINIITKKASETKGALVTAGGGNIDQGFGTVQYGGSAKSTDYRLYAKYFDQDHLPGLAAQSDGDGWHTLRGGFRTDTTISPNDTLMFEGDMYSASEGYPTVYIATILTPQAPIDMEVNLSGGYIQGTWDHTYASGSSSTLQVSYDAYERDDTVGDHRGTLDIDFSHHSTVGDRNDLEWGLNYQNSDSHSLGTLYTSFVPANLDTQLYGAFIQDEIAIRPDRLYLTVGTKIEHNHYSGLNVMPSARVAWTPSAEQTLWAAVSDAVQSPSAFDAGFRGNVGVLPGVLGPGGDPVVLAFVGNPDVDDESLIAYEAGYRTTVAKRLSFDFAAYYNDYRHLYTIESAPLFFEATPAPPHYVSPFTYENLMHGGTDGIEISANWKVADRWTLSPGYAFEEIHMHVAPTSHDASSAAGTQGSSPDHAAQLRSQVDLTHRITWSSSAYFVGRLTDPSVPSYTRVDTQLSWQFAEGATLSLVGQNLAQDHHLEFIDAIGSVRSALIKRSAYIKFTWKF